VEEEQEIAVIFMTKLGADYEREMLLFISNPI
jgi:hypothetical protein